VRCLNQGWEGRWSNVISRPDARVQDGDALHEIELYGELIIAASASEGPLDQAVIDAILGVQPAPAGERVSR
jgi:hypothetical protein